MKTCMGVGVGGGLDESQVQPHSRAPLRALRLMPPTTLWLKKAEADVAALSRIQLPEKKLDWAQEQLSIALQKL